MHSGTNSEPESMQMCWLMDWGHSLCKLWGTRDSSGGDSVTACRLVTVMQLKIKRRPSSWLSGDLRLASSRRKNLAETGKSSSCLDDLSESTSHLSYSTRSGPEFSCELRDFLILLVVVPSLFVGFLLFCTVPNLPIGSQVTK